MADVSTNDAQDTSTQSHDSSTDQDNAERTRSTYQDAITNIKDILDNLTLNSDHAQPSIAHLSLELNAILRLIRVYVLFQQRKLDLALPVLTEASVIAQAIRSELLQQRCYFWAGVIYGEAGQLTDAAENLVGAIPVFSQRCPESNMLPSYLIKYETQIKNFITHTDTNEEERETVWQTVQGIIEEAPKAAKATRRWPSTTSWEFVRNLVDGSSTTPGSSEMPTTWRESLVLESARKGPLNSHARSTVSSHKSFEGINVVIARLRNPKKKGNNFRGSPERVVSQGLSARNDLAGCDKRTSSIPISDSLPASLLGVNGAHHQNLAKCYVLTPGRVLVGLREDEEAPEPSLPSVQTQVHEYDRKGNQSQARQWKRDTTSASRPSSGSLESLFTQEENGDVPRSTSTLTTPKLRRPLDEQSTKVRRGSTLSVLVPSKARHLPESIAYQDKPLDLSATVLHMPVHFEEEKLLIPADNKLFDAVTPTRLDERIESTTGRRKSIGFDSLTSLPQSAREDFSSDSDRPLTHIRRLSTDPLSPSPLRQASLPEDMRETNVDIGNDSEHH